MRKLRYLWVVAVALFATACSDFLEQDPLSNANENGFYKTKKDMETALVSAYATLYDLYSPEGLVSYYGELMSDNVYCDNTAGTVSDYAAFDKHLNMDPSNGKVNEYWETCYKSLFIINQLIAKGEGKGDEVAEYVGEAKFLRALYYYYMVQAWGDVPLVLKPLSISEAYAQGRTPAAEVYAAIGQDLQEAAAALPDKAHERFAGAATSDAANVLLAKACLTQGNKSQAAAYLQKEYGKFALESSYADLWSLTNKNCRESIFELQYSDAPTSGMPYNSRWALFTPLDNRVVTAWGGGINQVTTDLWEAYEPGDPRRDLSIADGYKTSSGETNPTRYCIKWKDATAEVINLREMGRNNVILFRYADVLLLLAEATGEAKYLNEVRDRVGMPRYGTPAYPAQYATLDDAILHERQVELAMEYHRWYDLQRFSKAAAVMSACSKHVANPIVTLPIPQKVIDQNPGVMKQNAPW